MKAGENRKLGLAKKYLQPDRELPNSDFLRHRFVLVGILGVLSAGLLVCQATTLAQLIQHFLGFRSRSFHPQDLVVVFVIATGLRALFGMFIERSMIRMQGETEQIVRNQILKKILVLGPGWIANERRGELVQLATTGAASIGRYVGRFVPQLIVTVLAPAAILIWVASTDFMSFLILALMIGIFPQLTRVHSKRSKQLQQRQWRQLASLTSRYLDLLYFLPTLRAFNRESLGREEVSEATSSLSRTTIQILKNAFVSSLLLDFTSGIGIGLVAMALGLRLLGGSLSVGVALAILLLSPEVFLPIRRVNQEFHLAQDGNAAIERHRELLSHKEIKVQTQKPIGNIGSLVVENLSFSYPDKKDTVFRSLSFEVEKGARLFLKGPSGSGKSTVLSLACGFLEPMEGAIRIASNHGEDLGLLPRSSIALVPQLPHIFSGTLLDNLCFGATPPADWQRVIDAVGLSVLLEKLPLGKNTLIGERGIPVSPGERQRISLARALLKQNAEVILLDEPLQFLEDDAKQEIVSGINPLLAEKIVVVASHTSFLQRPEDQIVDVSNFSFRSKEILL